MYWGRAPQKEGSWFRLLLVEDWAITSRAAQVPAGAVQRPRARCIEIRRAGLTARAARREPAGMPLQGRRVTRALRALYARQRTARIGPDLSHRRTIVTAILRTRAVRAAVAQELREKKITRRQAMLQAQAYAQ